VLTRFLFIMCLTLFSFGCEAVDPRDDPDVESLTPRPSPLEYPTY